MRKFNFDERSFFVFVLFMLCCRDVKDLGKCYVLATLFQHPSNKNLKHFLVVSDDAFVLSNFHLSQFFFVAFVVHDSITG